MKLVLSVKGIRLVLYKNYTYSLHKDKVSKTSSCSSIARWRCSTHVNKGCNARIVVHDNSTVLKETGEHTHPPTKYMIRNNRFIRMC